MKKLKLLFPLLGASTFVIAPVLTAQVNEVHGVTNFFQDQTDEDQYWIFRLNTTDLDNMVAQTKTSSNIGYAITEWLINRLPAFYKVVFNSTYSDLIYRNTIATAFAAHYHQLYNTQLFADTGVEFQLHYVYATLFSGGYCNFIDINPQ